jgi:ubiquinone/menaquinone biosynthesis C-methylase UbiE
MTLPPESKPVASWDTYWQGARGGAAYSANGGAHPSLRSFWCDFVRELGESCAHPRIIDIASGSGAVIDCVRSVLGRSACDVTCVDFSESAIRALHARFPDVTGVVADASALPLESGSCDAVTSQFGVEYAGADAIDEIARLPVPGGRLALLMHQQGSSIYKRCAESVDVIGALQDAKFIPRAMAVFEAGFAACRGESRAAYEAAVAELKPAVQTVEAMIEKYGTQVADGALARLYGDVARIHGRLPGYVPGEVMAWLSGMQRELEAYSRRMADMCAAAVDADSFAGIRSKLTHAGFDISCAESLREIESGEPLGWALVGSKAPPG